MKYEIIQCEICDARHDTRRLLPESWVTIKQGSYQTELHFHDSHCLAVYFRFAQLTPQEPQEQFECKARRFLLVDGETADMYEGVKFGNGYVAVNGLVLANAWFNSWESLQEKCPGYGVQWIDKEVRQEVAE